ncbi:MAG: hypothetical protein ACPG4Z_01020 [Chitinophagales bacterium]
MSESRVIQDSTGLFSTKIPDYFDFIETGDNGNNRYISSSGHEIKDTSSANILTINTFIFDQNLDIDSAFAYWVGEAKSKEEVDQYGLFPFKKDTAYWFLQYVEETEYSPSHYFLATFFKSPIESNTYYIIGLNTFDVENYKTRFCELESIFDTHELVFFKQMEEKYN